MKDQYPILYEFLQAVCHNYYFVRTLESIWHPLLNFVTTGTQSSSNAVPTRYCLPTAMSIRYL